MGPRVDPCGTLLIFENFPPTPQIIYDYLSKNALGFGRPSRFDNVPVYQDVVINYIKRFF